MSRDRCWITRDTTLAIVSRSRNPSSHRGHATARLTQKTSRISWRPGSTSPCCQPPGSMPKTPHASARRENLSRINRKQRRADASTTKETQATQAIRIIEENISSIPRYKGMNIPVMSHRCHVIPIGARGVSGVSLKRVF